MAKPNYHDLTNLVPIDPDRVIKELKVKSRAKEAGDANRPSSAALDFDRHELAIIDRVKNYFADIRHDTTKRLQSLDRDIAATKSKLLSKVNLMDARNRYEKLKLDLDKGRRPFEDALANHQSEKLSLEEFKIPRGIKNVPPPSRSIPDKFAILMLFVLLESLANMYFFKEGNELGYLGGLIIAVGISAINVTFSYIVGNFFLKIWNSWFFWRKAIGAFVFVGIIVALTVGHTLIAFYRQNRFENSGLTTSESSNVAWTELTSLQFSNLEFQSMVLLGMGLGFGLYALYEGFTEGHPYPGYDRRYKKLRKFEQKLASVEGAFRNIHIEAIAKIGDDLNSLLSNQGRVRSQLEKLLRDRARIHNRREEFGEELAVVTNQVLTMYREQNCKARTDPPPAYFDNLFVDSSLFAVRGEFAAQDNQADQSALSGTDFVLHEQAEKLITEIYKTGEDIRILLESGRNV